MTVIAKSSVKAPEALDVDFFVQTLENGLRAQKIVVKEVFFEMGSGGGDNYCSQIYRVKVSYERDNGPLENVSLIVKSLPETATNAFLMSMGVFLKEKVFYLDLLPKMEILLDNTKFGPLCYDAVKRPIGTIVFEDLNTSGCVMADREVGLDEEHSKLVLKKLGQFHAVSMVLARKDPSSMNLFHSGMVSANVLDATHTQQAIFGSNLEGLIPYVRKWGPGFPEIADKLQRYFDNFVENLKKVSATRDDEIKVLNHGDLWVNNFMFKYDKKDAKKPTDVIFIDFQMSIYTSPGIDINYFLNTSVQLDVLRQKREDLINVYYEAFKVTLEDQKYPNIPSYSDIRNEVRLREPYGLFAAYGLFPIMTMDKSLSADNSIESMLDKESLNKKMAIMVKSTRLTDALKYSFKRFNELGVLD